MSLVNRCQLADAGSSHAAGTHRCQHDRILELCLCLLNLSNSPLTTPVVRDLYKPVDEVVGDCILPVRHSSTNIQ
jgi:hypothetical protein